MEKKPEHSSFFNADIGMIMKFLKREKLAPLKASTPDAMLALFSEQPLQHSELAMSNTVDLDSSKRTSANINPHNTRYIIAAHFKDCLFEDGNVFDVDSWVFFETRYFFVKFFQNAIEHVLSRPVGNTAVVKRNRKVRLAKGEGDGSRNPLFERFSFVDCSSMFNCLTNLRPVFFEALQAQSFDRGIDLKDDTGFSMTFKSDATLTEYSEALESIVALHRCSCCIEVH